MFNFVAILFILFCSYVGYAFIKHEVTCVDITSKIVEIGGCDRVSCAVRLEDGYKTTEVQPLLGDEITRCED